MAARPVIRSVARTTSSTYNQIFPLTSYSFNRTFASSQEIKKPISTFDTSDHPTSFGFETVTESEKRDRVAGVFSSVADSYDRMNDLMSMGVHRAWK